MVHHAVAPLDSPLRVSLRRDESGNYRTSSGDAPSNEWIEIRDVYVMDGNWAMNLLDWVGLTHSTHLVASFNIIVNDETYTMHYHWGALKNTRHMALEMAPAIAGPLVALLRLRRSPSMQALSGVLINLDFVEDHIRDATSFPTEGYYDHNGRLMIHGAIRVA